MVAKWSSLNMPWIELDNFTDVVLSKVRILDLLDFWKIEYSRCASGDFTHRMRCPLPVHADGQERTASFYVSETQNKFYCFGCNYGQSVVDLVCLYTGKPFYEAIKWLASFAKIDVAGIDQNILSLPKKEKSDPEKTVARHVYRSGVLIRGFLEATKGKKEYAKWCDWADNQFVKLDKYMDKMPDSDWEIVKKYYDKLLNYLESKK